MRRKSASSIRRDGMGGIEGLPLQLLILVVVAGVCLAMMLGWMGNVETPKSIGPISVDSGDMEIKEIEGGFASAEDVVITVLDQDRNPLEGATVVLTGLNVKTADGRTVHGTTDSDGKVIFGDLRLTIHGSVGFITVGVSKADYGEDTSCRITVIN